MLTLNAWIWFVKGQWHVYMNIVSAVALFAPVSSRLEILWCVFFLTWIHTSLGFLLRWPSCHSCFISLTWRVLGVLTCLAWWQQCTDIGLCCLGPLSTWTFYVLGEAKAGYGRHTACILYYFWLVTDLHCSRVKNAVTQNLMQCLLSKPDPSLVALCGGRGRARPIF